MSHDLKIERLIDATPQEVYDAFTQEDAHREWYLEGPNGIVRVDANDVSVGGTQNIAFGTADGEIYREINIFSEVDEPNRLAYTSTFIFPDGNSFETNLVITFEAQDSKTLFTIVQTGYPDEETRDAHLNGWPSFLDRMVDVIARRRAG